jgi:hypothetical protein
MSSDPRSQDAAPSVEAVVPAFPVRRRRIPVSAALVARRIERCDDRLEHSARVIIAADWLLREALDRLNRSRTR